MVFSTDLQKRQGKAINRKIIDEAKQRAKSKGQRSKS